METKITAHGNIDFGNTTITIPNFDRTQKEIKDQIAKIIRLSKPFKQALPIIPEIEDLNKIQHDTKKIADSQKSSFKQKPILKRLQAAQQPKNSLFNRIASIFFRKK